MTDQPPTFALGDRVRTLIDLGAADWAPEQPAIPAGSLGTVDYIHPSHRDPAVPSSYGVMLDGTVNRLSVSMQPDQIEAAPPVPATVEPPPYSGAEVPVAYALSMGGCSPAEVRETLASLRAQYLTEAADHFDRLATQVEARVAEHYGPASGIGPGSAAMVRMVATDLRTLAAGGAW